ncbi:sialic acid-binding Ig-like lectin 11 isoform X2 [Mustela putorius furo]|uniref:Sialic acid-binding Ig-like lectin 11 isoform X2 n=1 Tax=Mustela putorius furo TaxID=9669 RepID=A0A8U0RZN9_MUSPF|nr:sialic acid-binding Ig-like lectin 11 isoform X2 [Mustela putorius furo]
MPLWLLLMLWIGSVAQVLSYKLKLQKSMTVQEGLCVHVPCEFYYPWLSFMSPYMSWFQKGADVNQDPPVATNKPNQKLHERTQGRFFIRGDLQTGNCSLDITEVHKGDSGTYFFQLGTYSYLDTMFSLNVTALTHTPHIIIPGTLESGHPRNLTCSVPWAREQGTSPIFSWTSAALTSLGTRTHFSSVLTLTPRPQDHGTNLTCQVYFPAVGVMVERTVQLNVTYAPQNTAIRIFQGSRIGPQISICWTVGAAPGKSSEPPLQAFGVDSASSLLRASVDIARGEKHQLHTTQVSLSLSLSLSLSISLLKALGTLQNTSSVLISEGQALQLLCVTDSNPPAELSWFRGSPTWKATPICRSPILDLSQVGAVEEGDLICQAQNPLGSQHISLHLSVVYPLQLFSPSCSWEGEGLRCNCSSRAQWAPTLRWRLGEELLEGNHSNTYWTVTSNSAGPWANSSLSLSGLLSSSLRLSCEAQNAQGKQSAAVLLLPDKPEPRTSGVVGAVAGAGTMALLSLCLCLIFRVKTGRKKAVQPVQSTDMSPAGNSGSGAYQYQSSTDIPAAPPPPAEARPISEEEQELHYALLRFPKPKYQERKDIHTEYSEIKTHK